MKENIKDYIYTARLIAQELDTEFDGQLKISNNILSILEIAKMIQLDDKFNKEE